MADLRSVVASLHRIPQLAAVDEQSLLLPQWSTLETVFLHLFRLTPQLSDIAAFIQQRQHDRTLERLHPTPASLALARDREALYRQLVVELVYGQLYGVKEGKRRAAKAAGGLLLGEKGEGVQVIADLVKRAMGQSEEEKRSDESEGRERQDARETEDEKRALQDERKYADSGISTGSARKKASLSSPATPDSSHKRPSTAAVSSGSGSGSGAKRGADSGRPSKPTQPVPAAKSAAARRRTEEEKEREAREERDRQRKQEREEEDKMAGMREMRRQKGLRDAKRAEQALRTRPLPASPSSDVDDSTEAATGSHRPFTASARQPAALGAKMGGTAAGGSGQVAALERQLREEKAKVAALERRVREIEGIVSDEGAGAVGEDSWRQQLLLHAQCEQWRRQCALLQGVVDGKRQVMDEMRTVCEWMREGGKRMRRLEKASGSGEEEGRRLVSGLSALVSEMVQSADEAMKRIDSLDQHTNTLSASSPSPSLDALSHSDSAPSLPAGLLSTLTSFAAHLKSAHPVLVETQQAALVASLDRSASAHNKQSGRRVADAAEQIASLADESRRLGQLLLPYSHLSYSTSSVNALTPLSSSLASSLSSTALSATERRQLLAVVGEAECVYASDLRTYSTHLTTLYPLLSSLVSTSSSLLTSLSPLLRQLSSLSSASASLSSAATASSASKRIADVMRLVTERADEWTSMEQDIRRAQDDMSRLIAEGKESLALELRADGQQRRSEQADGEVFAAGHELEEDRRWRPPHKSAAEHERHGPIGGRPYSGKVQHEQEWQS